LDKTSKPRLIFMVLLCLALLAGACHLLFLRFQKGDAYPAYSSLRSGPLGSKVVYEAFKSVDGVRADRNFRDFPDMDIAPGTTVIFLGVSPWDFESAEEAELAHLDSLAARGCRVVIALLPENPGPDSEDISEGQDEEANGEEAEEDKSPLLKHWGLCLDAGYVSPHKARLAPGAPKDLPQSLSWHSSVFFCDVTLPWKEIYTRHENPVVIEKTFGKGSIVCMTDSYLLSNEAMKNERRSSFISWIVGKNRRVVFDEMHLGVTETQGMGDLVAKYRLQGFLMGLVMLAGLYIWRHAVPLAPPAEKGNGNIATVLHKDHAQGLVHLLRKSTSENEMPSICFEEWKRSLGGGSLVLEEKIKKMESVLNQQRHLPARRQDPVKTYKDMADIASSTEPKRK